MPINIRHVLFTSLQLLSGLFTPKRLFVGGMEVILSNGHTETLSSFRQHADRGQITIIMLQDGVY